MARQASGNFSVILYYFSCIVISSLIYFLRISVYHLMLFFLVVIVCYIFLFLFFGLFLLNWFTLYYHLQQLKCFGIHMLSRTLINIQKERCILSFILTCFQYLVRHSESFGQYSPTKKKKILCCKSVCKISCRCPLAL